MKVFTCIIVDDDEMDRLVVQSYAKRFDTMKIVGVFDSAEKALTFLETNTVDIAFLDIELKKATGIELRKKAQEIPACVFISSHSELAADTFELETIDFIVKPYKFPRFQQAVNRIMEFMEVRHKAELFEASLGGDVVYIKVGNEQVKVKTHDILYLEALKNYTLVVTDKKRYCVLSSIGDLLQEKIFNSFVRVHRSFAVQKLFVQKIGSNDVILNNNVLIPLGRSYKDNLSLII
jgi:two-component system, LytTR family, response regulator